MSSLPILFRKNVHENCRSTYTLWLCMQCLNDTHAWCGQHTCWIIRAGHGHKPLYIHNDIDMFADDSTLHTSGPNIEEIQLNLQTDLNVITTWCTDNNMIIITSKTKTMLITTQQRRHHLQNDRLSITLNEHDHFSNARVIPTYKAVFIPMVEDTVSQLIHNASLRLLRDCLEGL